MGGEEEWDEWGKERGGRRGKGEKEREVREMDGNERERKREEIRGGEEKVEWKKESEKRQRKGGNPEGWFTPPVRQPENTLLLLHDGWFTRTRM